MVKEYIRTNKVPRFSKSNVSLRDEYECQYCGAHLPTRESITLDHVIPSSMGGKTCWDNIVISCGKCNHSKGSKLIKPNRAPYRPTYYELVNKRKRFPMHIPHPSWEQYL
jgi:5-methylcytosine-specific restriction endonuclease McrA